MIFYASIFIILLHFCLYFNKTGVTNLENDVSI